MNKVSEIDFNPEDRDIKSDDPFNIESLRLSQNFAELTGVKKALTTVPVRKPDRQEFVRVHPGEECQLATYVLELKKEQETYQVAPELWPELSEELVSKILFLTINRQKVLTIWPVRLPDDNGRLDQYSASALQAAQMARKQWLKVMSNRDLGAYEMYIAPGEWPEPEWPDLSFSEILDVAFKDRRIADLDHPVIRRLRGEL